MFMICSLNYFLKFGSTKAFHDSERGESHGFFDKRLGMQSQLRSGVFSSQVIKDGFEHKLVK